MSRGTNELRVMRMSAHLRLYYQTISFATWISAAVAREWWSLSAGLVLFVASLIGYLGATRLDRRMCLIVSLPVFLVPP